MKNYVQRLKNKFLKPSEYVPSKNRQDPSLGSDQVQVTSTISAQAEKPINLPSNAIPREVGPTDPQEQFNLALRYHNGQGVKQDYQQAVIWFRKAAEQGHAGAQFRLGFMHASGHGVKQDDQQAVIWYRKAAEQGHANALTALNRLEQKIPDETKSSISTASIHALVDAETLFNQGMQHLEATWERQNIEKSAELLLQAATLGHARAQFQLAMMYLNGSGVPQSANDACHWLQQAANQQHLPAQNELAWMLKSGHGGIDNQQSLPKAEPALNQLSQPQDALQKPEQKKTAEPADKEGLTRVSPAQDVGQYRQAAERGDSEAQFNLGSLYYEGLSIPANYKLAYVWLSLAVIGGQADALPLRDQVAARLTDEALLQAQELAAEYFERTNQEAIKSCKNSMAPLSTDSAQIKAPIPVGSPYQAEKPINQPNATIPQEVGPTDPQEQFNLALRYNNGQGVKQDYKEAVKWYRKAAEQGHAEAQYKLGFMYENGRGVVQSDKDAAIWYRKAADQGDVYAQLNLAQMYEYGQGVQKNKKEAVKLYRLSAAQGVVDAITAINRLEPEIQDKVNGSISTASIHAATYKTCVIHEHDHEFGYGFHDANDVIGDYPREYYSLDEDPTIEEYYDDREVDYGYLEDLGWED